MLLIAAQDQGRLSQDPRLEDLFHRLHESTPETVLGSIGAFKEDVVLFWHEDAHLALNALGQIQRRQLWPNNLFGVVLFRGAQYAGLGNRAKAEAALAHHGLDGKQVHVLKSLVINEAPVALVDGIQNFVDALSGKKPTHPPFGLLQPAEQNDSALTLLCIDWLNSAAPELGAQIMPRVFWERVNQDLGLTLGTPPSPAALATAASTIRATSAICAEECALCGERQYLWHRAEKLCHFSGDERLDELRSMVTRAIPMFASPRAMEDELVSTTMNALLIDDVAPVDATLREALRQRLREQCRLQTEVSAELARIQSVLQTELPPADLRQAARDFCDAVACDAVYGFKF